MSEEVNDSSSSELTDITFNGFIKKYEEFVKFLKDCVNEISVLKNENRQLKEDISVLNTTMDRFKMDNDRLRDQNQALLCQVHSEQATAAAFEVNQLRSENKRLRDELQSLSYLREEMDVLQVEVSNLTEQRDMIRTELMEVRNENDLLCSEIRRNKKALDIAKSFFNSANVNGVVNSLPTFSEQMVLTEDKANSMTAFGSLVEMQGLRPALDQSKEDTYHSTRMTSAQTSEETYYSAISSHRSSLANGSTGARPKLPNGIGPTLDQRPLDSCVETKLNETLITRTTESSDYKIDENNNLRLKQVKVAIGKLLTVKMAYYISPSDFFLHINPYKVHNYIHIIQVKQNDLHQQPNSVLTAADITLGMYCAAIYSEDGLWYRAQVIQINYEDSVEKDSIKSVLVLYIDWGNTEERPLSKIMRLSLELTERKQAIHCYIQGYDSTNWSAKERKDFEESVKDKKLSALFHRFHKRNEQLESLIYPIDLIFESDNGTQVNAVELLPLTNLLNSTDSELAEPDIDSSPTRHRESTHTSETIVCKNQQNGHSTGNLAQEPNDFRNRDLETKSKSNQNCSTNSDSVSNRVPELVNQVPKSMPHLNATHTEHNDSDCLRISCPNVVDLNCGDGLIVQVAHISNPEHFYLYINDVRFGTGQLEDLDDQLNQFYSKKRPFPCVQRSDVIPGSFWVCPYNIDQRWYRCRVLKVDGDKILVNYVDYGNDDLVDINDLKTLTRQFAIYPAMAVKCRLSNVSAVNSNNWSRDSIEYFRHLTSDEKPLTAFVAQKPENFNFDSFLDVFLWTTDTNDEDISVNLLLIVNKHAITDNEEWVREAERRLKEKTPPKDLMPEIIFKINSKSIPSESSNAMSDKFTDLVNGVNVIQSNDANPSANVEETAPLSAERGDEWDKFGMNEDAFCDDNTYNHKLNDPGIATMGFEMANRRTCRYYGTPKGCHLQDLCSFKHMEPDQRFEINDTEEELFQIDDLVLQVNSFVVLKVTQVTSPFSFYGVLPYGPKDINKYDLTEDCPQFEDLHIICSQLKKAYSNRTDPNLNIYPAIGSLVAYRDESQTYYRGRVIGIDMETKTCDIFNIDLGVETTVARNSVFKLHSVFTHLPAQAIQCSLFGILPISGTAWNRESVDSFFDWVNQRVVGAHIMYGQTEGKFYVELVDKEGDQEVLLTDKLVANNLARRDNSINYFFDPSNDQIDSDEIYQSEEEYD